MNILSSLRSFASALFHRSRFEHDMDDELRAHIRDRASDLERSGIPRAEAERRARLDFGGYQKFKEEVRESAGTHFVDSLAQDVRFALRMLRKSPGFAAIAVLTLALGIGANTAMFSVVNTSLLRPLPFSNPAQLVDIWARSSVFDFPNLGLSLADIADLRSQSTAFSAIAPYNYSGMTLTGRGAPRHLDGTQISAELFPLLGIRPLYGRSFTNAEMQPGQDREIILSFPLWKEQFGGDPRAVGTTITLDNKSYTIVGVMPPQQHLNSVADVQFWVPFAPAKAELANRPFHGTPVIARLKPGRTIQQAQAELDAIGARLAKTYPDADKNWSFRLASLESDVVGNSRAPLLILLAAVGFVLLIACANIGNLFLSRGWTRRRELAIRSALGATRSRIVRQLLVEGLLVALIGGLCGLLIAVWGVEGLRTLLPANTPRIQDLSIDPAVLWFTFAASILAGLLFSLAPAALVSKQDTSASVKEGSAQAGSGTQHKFLRQSLVAGEIALALLLVIGATLALRSFARLLAVNMGFRSDHLLTMYLDFPSGKFTKPDQALSYIHEILAAVRSAPGVQDASASGYSPLSGTKGETTIHTDAMAPGAPAAMTQGNRATPRYFQTLGIPLLAGRDFAETDNTHSPDVYIVNQAFAKTFFAGVNPVGRRIGNFDANHKLKWGQIVGEIADTRDQRAKEAPAPELFAPLDQTKDPTGPGTTGVALVVRTKSDPLATLSAVENRIWSIDKAQPVENVATMDQLLSESHAAPRFQTFLLGVFGGLGLLLAVVGIYGVISYSVAQRTHEIGIRMALGANPLQVMRLVLSQGLNLALIGAAIGIVASFALTRLMAGLLFGISATDPLTFISVTAILVAVAVAACYIPARRAMRVDPVRSLRCE
ncbi:MAG TPA: ABC transporter permease [Candidatus Acidoferrales bacterium]|nr:ABC transporter permease [Candidatus Acidoferrales bacterium]